MDGAGLDSWFQSALALQYRFRLRWDWPHMLLRGPQIERLGALSRCEAWLGLTGQESLPTLLSPVFMMQV